MRGFNSLQIFPTASQVDGQIRGRQIGELKNPVKEFRGIGWPKFSIRRGLAVIVVQMASSPLACHGIQDQATEILGSKPDHISYLFDFTTYAANAVWIFRA